MNWNIRSQLKDELAAAAENPEVRVVVIRGDAKAFSAGGDITEMGGGPGEAAAKLKTSGEIIEIIAAMSQPVIAAVEGHAAGAGMSLAIACDLVYAAEGTLFTPSFVLRGLGPDMSGSYWLPRHIGLHRAKELLLTGAALDAREALALGLISDVWPLEEYEEKLRERVAMFAAGPTRAYGEIKRLLNTSLDHDLREQLDAESRGQTQLSQTEDHVEAISAFREKRSFSFSGR